jgi:glutamate-1-semialdehyde 2,1-aminomutase
MKRVCSDEQYIAKFPKSKMLYESAKALFPRGVTHDGWFMLPFPICISHARGSHEWDVDGHEYVDYFGGHGALLLGHSHYSLIKAASSQIKRGTHYGACDEQQIKWGKLIQNLVPSAELIEFTNSGTEAGLIGIRLARAFTGRKRVVKFRNHFHGLSSNIMIGLTEPWDVPDSAGITNGEVEDTVVIPVNNEKVLEDILLNRDVAVLMVEASNPNTSLSFYQTMRDLANKYGTLLLFDEVITGFRCSAGGLQKAVGVTPDLTMLGKAIAGGVGGVGAIVGRANVMNMLDFKTSEWNRYRRVCHTGTWNGNPLVCAVGIATLKILATGEPQRYAEKMTSRLREGMQFIMEKRGVRGCVYGNFSGFFVYVGECSLQGKCDRKVCKNTYKTISDDLTRSILKNLALNGVHVSGHLGPCGYVSSAHDDEDIDKTIEAFDNTILTILSENEKQLMVRELDDKHR